MKTQPTWKWKRPRPGYYTYDNWVIEGTGTDWELRRVVNGESKIIAKLNSKKLCKLAAENKHDIEQKPTPAPRPAPPPPPQKENIGSVLASFRLEVSRLTDMVGVLSNSIENLAKKID